MTNNLSELSGTELVNVMNEVMAEVKSRLVEGTVTKYVAREIPSTVLPHQQRAETIQRAREFVRNNLGNDFLVINHDYYKNPRVEFFRKGNRTTCVITPENTMLDRFVGRSFCSIGDVFNEWIGKAIALAKALQIDIPQEFVDAVQPDTPVVGHVVFRSSVLLACTGVRTIKEKGTDEKGEWYKTIEEAGTSRIEHFPTILDDTNATYHFESVGD